MSIDDKDPIAMCEQLLEQRLQGILIDDRNGTMRLTFEHGFIEIEGDDYEAYIELDELNG